MRNSKQTTFDLNGPILSFATQPVGVASTGVGIGSTATSGIATFIGIATATFTTGVSSGSPTAPSNPASNTGIITYRWYEVGVGALSDSTYVTGTGTTTLTLTNLITPTDNQRQFYLTADYNPSAYGLPGVAVTVGSARSTGNAILEPVSSGISILTVYPLIEIIAQPSDTQTVINNNATISVNAGLTDSYFGDVTYQWYLNGLPLTDGIIQETTTIQGNTQQKQNINQTYTSDTSVTLTDATNVVITVAGGSGGNGGNDSGGSGGTGALARQGTLTYNNGSRTLTFLIGKRGNDGTSGNENAGGSGGSSSYARGGNGGGAGDSGWSGGGGGGGGATAVLDSTKPSSGPQVTIVASGGAGAGGGSLNRPSNVFIGIQGTGGGLGFGRAQAALQGRYDSPKAGNPGQSKGSGDGGGGGGGGGGASPSNFSPFGDGGAAGTDNSSGGQGGSGGASGFDSNYASFGFNGTGSTGDGYVNISYNGVVNIPTTVTATRTTTVSGSNTSTLTIKSDQVGVQTAICRISNPIATNNYVESNLVFFTTLSTTNQYKIQVESIGISDNATISNIDLFNGEYTFTSASGDPTSGRTTNYFSFYAPDRNINVEMDLYGGKGTTSGTNSGGEGGFSRIRFTMTQNTEYVIAGLTDTVGTPFIYRKGQLIACVGKGGNAGTTGRGGFGGGIGIAGDAGFGRDAGVGGALITAGNLGGDGVFGSLTSLVPTTPDTKATAPNGGRALKCTKGVYWRDQGVSACTDVGTVKFRLSDGVEVTNTASIARGYKAGYDIIQTAGRGSSNGGAGGNGATGGAGGQNGSGGGGGSGYTDGSITVVNTQLGGSTGNARVVLRYVS